MPKPADPRAVGSENRAFVQAIERTGNVREAARRIGKAYGTMQHRRKRGMVFAQRWDAVLALALARFDTDGAQRPVATAGAHRTAGGEGVVVRRNDGRLQFRRAQPGKLRGACEQAFLPPMTASQALQLMYLHQKEARLQAEPAHDACWRARCRPTSVIWRCNRLRSLGAPYEVAREAGAGCKGWRSGRGLAPFTLRPACHTRQVSSFRLWAGRR